MITNHPAYPKKEIDKYYLQTKLPEYQTVPINEHQKKTHDYYNDNTHIWNNPHQAKSNAKVFKQLKEQHDQGQKRIKKLQEVEQKEKQELQRNKIIYYNMAREEDLMRLQQRKLERGSLQNLSSQRNDVQVDSIAVKPILSRTALLGRPDHLWNKLNQQSQKYVNLLINPKILQMEEQGVKAISEKISKDLEIEQIKEELRLQNMEHIKQQSTLRRMTNLEMEQRSGILPSRLSLQRVATAQTNCRQPKDVIESTLQQLEHQQQSQTIQQLQNQIINSAQYNQTSRPYTVGSDFNSISFNAGQTAKIEQRNNPNQNQTTPIFLVNGQKSKSVSTLSHKHPLDRTEFKGLLLAQAVEQAESNFSKTLKANSSLLKETSIHLTRTKQSMIPKKRIQIKCNSHFPNEQNKNDQNDLQIVNSMLDSFERKLYRTNYLDDENL
ncbi:unnamed protein product (macronuclear) [Paramecium tetraurelia]|uniref:Uncharacterized protein n=1 Tax=Paramecium tetraurelia TaxID=5888 RepID=A0BSW8_PARTE|nr:uncharacterized protein GSPATT00031867001 [Paramecium tetraurelia]CAK61635.1 unnamed protein product [Paramecium tetraurelia]|eukprot:XP_001429033.1 hypothetical protein (macronuclear) [Paramecium tetraurelia strain d4-2]